MNAATTTDSRPKPIISSLGERVVQRASTSTLQRTDRRRAATLSSSPESTAETGVGTFGVSVGQPVVQRHEADFVP
jgi:surface antigen